jgi:hypothetical protein
MRIRRFGKYWAVLLLVGVVVIGGTSTVFAQTSTSNNYQMTESQFGSTSLKETCSEQYCARVSLGDSTSGGASKSPKTTSSFGPITPEEPLLEVIVDPGVSNLGDLTTEQTATKTMNVRIRNYLSDGYTLQITGDPPSYKNHKLKTSSMPVASKPGTEQFGINAVANTTPNVGANPLQIPSNAFSFGELTSAYSTPNVFKYTSGEVVARSRSESGQTNYTISMMVNIANSTPAGLYNGEFSAVVIPIY